MVVSLGNVLGGLATERGRRLEREQRTRGIDIQERGVGLAEQQFGFAQEQAQAQQEQDQLAVSVQALEQGIANVAQSRTQGEQPFGVEPLRAAISNIEAVSSEEFQRLTFLLEGALGGQTPTAAATQAGRLATVEAVARGPVIEQRTGAELGLSGEDATRNFNVNTETGQATAIGGRGTVINVGTGDRRAEEKAVEVINTINEEARAASTQNDIIELAFRQLDILKDSALEPGVFANMAQSLGNFVISVGGSQKLADEVAASEDFEGLSNKLTLLETQILKGAISNKEIDFVNASVSALNKTDLGDRFALARLRSTGEKKVLLAVMIGEAQQNPNISRDQALKQAQREWEKLPHVSGVASPEGKPVFKLRDQFGVPVFFTDFLAAARRRDPTLTLDETVTLWNQAEASKGG